MIEFEEKSVVVFDVDGTLADIHHRRIYLNEDPPNWHKFNELMGDLRPKFPPAHAESLRLDM